VCENSPRHSTKIKVYHYQQHNAYGNELLLAASIITLMPQPEHIETMTLKMRGCGSY
jgi:hypothetical protein